jgi:hypothetical protein
MKVCICGGTNPATNPKYFAVAQEMGELLVNNDFEMVWGGNAFGVLSHVHQQYIEKQKKNTLVLPAAYEGDLATMKVDANKTVHKTKEVSARTVTMFSMTNAVVCIPGGIGTIYEFWSAVEYRRAEEFDIEIILLNYKGFYKHQLEHFKFINENGFTKSAKAVHRTRLRPRICFMSATLRKMLLKF